MTLDRPPLVDVTEEFPVAPEEFVERDFDFPRIPHAVEVEVYDVAAGATGVTGVISEPGRPPTWRATTGFTAAEFSTRRIAW